MTPLVGNPYLDELRRADPKRADPRARDDWRWVMENIGQLDVPPDRRVHRDQLVAKYAWAIPSDDAIAAIADFACGRGVVEIGAGTGYWAALLAAAGVDVVAYDNGSWGTGDRRVTMEIARWFPVRMGSWRAVRKHADRTLLLCWPPYSSPMGWHAVRAYIEAGGHSIAFVGESEGGCTGDKRMFHALDTHCTRERGVSLPQWPGLHDDLHLYAVNGVPRPARKRRAITLTEEEATA